VTGVRTIMLQVLLIAVFAVLFIREDMGRTWFRVEPGMVAAITLSSLAVVWLVSHMIVAVLGRRLDRRGDLRAVPRADLVTSAARTVAVCIHVFSVLGLGWLDVVRAVVGNLVLVDEVLAALPVLVVIVGTWWSMYGIDRRLREALLIRDLDDGRPIHSLPSRGAYVLAAVRHQAALILVPVMAIGAWNEVVERWAGRWTLPPWLPSELVQFAGILVVLTLIPAVLRRVWDTARLGPGPLRDTLEGMCRDHRVRVRELLVWRTHGGMVNGAVMGLFGPLRYVLLTDALLETLTPVQVEAVMAHELAHVRRKHMLWLGVAALGSIGLVNIMGEILLRWLDTPWAASEWARGAAGVMSIVFGLILFGFVSRRFEWQADAFAAQHLSGYRTGTGSDTRPITAEAVSAMSSALTTVAQFNHIPMNRFTWRHGSIAERKRRLEGLLGQPANRLRPDREAGLLKIAAAVAFVAAGLLAWRLSGGWEVARADGMGQGRAAACDS